MSLPGLGIFTLDKSVVLPEEHDRALLSMPNAVQFQNANIASAEKELITFICEETGKIKPLAISDLDSYLSLGTEMLNIGKPFHLEGIGTITKNKTGKFDFTPGEYTVIKENTAGPDHGKHKQYKGDKNQGNLPSVNQNRNLLKLFVVLVALAIVGWGGWMMYKKNSLPISDKNQDTNSVVQEAPPAVTDSSVKTSVQNDSSKLLHRDSVHPAKTNNNEAANYKFIILTTNDKARALKRYNQLLSFDLEIHLYQKDSTLFKVYFQFPALAKDTVQIKDSLRREYAHEVLIEQ